MKLAAFAPRLDTDIAAQITEFCQHEADILLLPEYLLELTDFEPAVVADKLVVFGSRIVAKRNELIYSDGQSLQSYHKIKMTPWEKHLQPGQQPVVVDFKGLRVGIVVCFDIEYPDLADFLRTQQLDLLLVPSATETILGYERVSRCASARAVELGCAVLTCHLVGETENEMVDINVGANNLFLPSQSLFAEMSRHEINAPRKEGGNLNTYELPLQAIRQQRKLTSETNPSLID